MSLSDAIAKRVEEKPIPSMVAFQLLKIIEDEDHALKDVVKIVENDASLTTEVLKVANSAAFFRGMPVTTVNRAVALLGEMMVVGVAICASSSIVFNSPLEGYESPEGEMWEHSLRSAIASREVAKYAKNVSTGLAFTAGLLHDIGKSVLSEFLQGSSENITNLLETRNAADYIEAEQTFVGTDHAQVGFALAKHWGLPEALCITIRDHHRPSSCEDRYRGLAYTVHLGDLIAMMGGSGTGSDAMAYGLDPGYGEYITLDKKKQENILLTVQQDFMTIKESIMTR